MGKNTTMIFEHNDYVTAFGVESKDTLVTVVCPVSTREGVMPPMGVVGKLSFPDIPPVMAKLVEGKVEDGKFTLGFEVCE